MKNERTKALLRRLPGFGQVLLGNLIYACAIAIFLEPADLIMGGATGIALFLNDICGVSMSAFLLVFNVAALIWGRIVLGRSFALSTVVSSFAYPVFLEIIERLSGGFVLTDDLFLCTVFSGIGIGLGLGLVLRAGSSTGGMDIPSLIVSRALHLPISVTMYGFDMLVILLQACFSDRVRLLYGIVLLIIYTLVMDRTILRGTAKTEVKIISRHSEKIREAILNQTERGVTCLTGKGGFLREDTEVLLSVVSNRELASLEKLVHSLDPECFLIVTRVSEVKGRGFTADRVELEQEQRPL